MTWVGMRGLSTQGGAGVVVRVHGTSRLSCSWSSAWVRAGGACPQLLGSHPAAVPLLGVRAKAMRPCKPLPPPASGCLLMHTDMWLCCWWQIAAYAHS